MAKKNDQMERDILFLALMNKAIEMNTTSINYSKDTVYRDINTLLYNITMSIEDNIRMNYLDDEILEIDSSKFKNVKPVQNDDDEDDDEL